MGKATELALVRAIEKESGRTVVGQRVLAERVGSSERAIRNWLASLERQGIVKRRVRYVDGKRAPDEVVLVEPATGTATGKPFRHNARAGDASTSPSTSSRVSPRAGDRVENGNGRHRGVPSSVPIEERETSEFALQLEDASSVVPTYRGRPANRVLWERAVAVLAAWNDLAGQRLAALKGNGAMSEAAKRIYGRLIEHPGLEVEFLRTVIARNLAEPWWKGRPSPGVVFGPNVFESAIEVGPSRAAEKEERGRRRDDAYERLAGTSGLAEEKATGWTDVHERLLRGEG